jgi:hypothetical protein
MPSAVIAGIVTRQQQTEDTANPRIIEFLHSNRI